MDQLTTLRNNLVTYACDEGIQIPDELRSISMETLVILLRLKIKPNLNNPDILNLREQYPEITVTDAQFNTIHRFVRAMCSCV